MVEQRIQQVSTTRKEGRTQNIGGQIDAQQEYDQQDEEADGRKERQEAGDQGKSKRQADLGGVGVGVLRLCGAIAS